MIIGIDASRAFMPQRTGIEEYSYQVIYHLRNKLKGAQVFLYIKKNQKVDFDLPENWKVKIIAWPRFWTQIGLSLEMLYHPVDALFIPAHTVPIIHPKNTIVTIHGLEYEKFPEGYSFWSRLYMRAVIKRSCRWARKIIAVSKNTKKDLVELYKVPEEKIEVIYEGVKSVIASEAKQSREIATARFAEAPARRVATLPHNDKYILFIGRLEKRKNIEGIIEAYKILKEKYNIPHILVLAGTPGYGYESIKYKVGGSKYKADIIQTGYVSEEEKNSLLKNADIFLFPSFYEGFGLPILEAQAAGVPVVASNISSMPEVGGDGAAYCRPQESESIALAIHKFISDHEFRDDIIKKGLENVKRFSWENCASAIADILTR